MSISLIYPLIVFWWSLTALQSLLTDQSKGCQQCSSSTSRDLILDSHNQGTVLLCGTLACTLFIGVF